MRIAALHKVNGSFLVESIVHPLTSVRGIESSSDLTHARKTFSGQGDIDSYVTARGGNPSLWVALTLPDGYQGS